MTSTDDNIVKMEQDADRLVEELALLKREVGSYRGAAGELEKTRIALGSFIEATQKLAGETYKLVEATKGVGGAQILNEMTQLREVFQAKAKKDATARLFLGGMLLVVLVLQIFAIAR
jgi:hypothetical protein